MTPSRTDETTGGHAVRGYNRAIQPSLRPGVLVGPYEVLSPLGAGGMGEVYRARDTKLDRDIALKILPSSFASDPDRLMRFEREAKTLASISHPNIGAIYGIEDPSTGSGQAAIVMELIEGEDLSQRIARGPLPFDDALPIARQVADALEAAHEQGIIHRDLKPANIKVKADGTVKVLDFGLAKALAYGDGGHPAGSAAITSPAMTAAGLILGTAAYMSPEQAKGRSVDRRSDIWAFGCVLFEMLTGQRAFPGDDVTETLAAVIRGEPAWSALPAATPASVRRVLTRCLEKDHRRRLGDIHDARLDLDEVAANEPAASAVASVRSRAMRALPWTVAAIFAIALAASWTFTRRAPAPPASRYPIALADGVRMGPTTWAPMAVSPDGSHLVYVGESGRLVARSRGRLESVELPGTDGAFNPFFSPDGSRVGFMSGTPGNAQLRVAPLDGGPPLLITATGVGGPGATWGTDGFIYFDASGIGPLRRIKATGGDSEVVSTLDSAAGELQHNWPDALPGGRGVLFTINRGGPGVNISQSDDVGVLDLASGRHRVLVHGVLARYAASGHIIYVTSEGVLMAAPFDENRLEVTGNSVAMIENINIRTESGGIDVALARNGTLWYASGTRQGRQEVLWATPLGIVSAVEAGWTGAFKSLSLSPNDRQLALTIADDVGQQIWIKDLSRPNGTLSKITHERVNGAPRWHPDGTRVTFTSLLIASGELRSARADGTGDQSVLADDLYVLDGGWTRDGKWLVYSGGSKSARVFRHDVHAFRPGVDEKPAPLLATNFNERNASVSPDGRWLVFQSNSTGRYEVYVRPFPDTSASQAAVSTGGGSRPKWSRDGRDIFYENGTNELTRVPVVAGPTFSVGKPSTLFPLTGVQDWDVASDGRIVLIRAAEGDRGGQLIVVEDFFEELRRKVGK